MDGESFISPVVEFLREILYDILGLFFPGAALLVVLKHSGFDVIHKLIDPLTSTSSSQGWVIFVGVSYVAGYAVQGFAGRFWTIVVLRLVRRIVWLYDKDQRSKKAMEQFGMRAISPAFLQVKNQLEESEVFRSFRGQAARYCEIDDPSRLSLNDVQNLAYSIAYDRADNAFTFSFRADLANGLFFVFLLGGILALFDGTLSWKTVLLYGAFASGFALRAWTYYSIRGRIIYSIALAALAEYRKRPNGTY